MAVAWSWAQLAKDAFITASAVMWTCGSVADECVEELCEGGYEYVLLLEGVGETFG